MDLTDPQQWNAYTYSNNNPVTFSDPSGLVPTCDNEGNTTCPSPSPSRTTPVPGDTYVPDSPEQPNTPPSVPSFPAFIEEVFGTHITNLPDETVGKYFQYYFCVWVTFECSSFEEAWAIDVLSSQQQQWLELIGYTDAEGCAGGDAGSCVRTGLNVVPFGLIGKLAKLSKIPLGPAYLSEARWTHIKEGHFPGGKDVIPGESGVFIGNEDLVKDRIFDAIYRGRPMKNTDGRPGYTYTVDFGGYEVGYKIDRSGQRIPLQFYTVVVNEGRVVTAYPH